MSEIKFRKSDKKMTTFEVMKQTFIFVSVICIFDFMFYIQYLQVGTIASLIPMIVCGLPMSLILLLLSIQSMKHFLGFGHMVITSDNQMVLRTPSSGREKTSRLSSLSKMITNPMAKMMMREADKDGDGQISFDEYIDMAFDDLSINKKPWEWDFKMAYERISKQFDLPSGNLPISFEDFSIYTDSEDRTNFDEIDIDNDGFITKEQLIDYLWEQGKSEFTELRIEFDKYDVDGNGYISLEELSTLISSGHHENWAEEKTNNWWSNDEN
jgi:Ca2+-binding EF-hand superfamily protein